MTDNNISKSLSHSELNSIVSSWMDAWNNHDLDTVMALFDADTVFESWTGAKVHGKEKLRTAWANWFINHGNFHFKIEEMIIDETNQHVVITWKLDWVAPQNKREIRHGIDLLRFENALITLKRSYSQPPKPVT